MGIIIPRLQDFVHPRYGGRRTDRRSWSSGVSRRKGRRSSESSGSARSGERPSARRGGSRVHMRSGGWMSFSFSLCVFVCSFVCFCCSFLFVLVGSLFRFVFYVFPVFAELPEIWGFLVKTETLPTWFDTRVCASPSCESELPRVSSASRAAACRSSSIVESATLTSRRSGQSDLDLLGKIKDPKRFAYLGSLVVFPKAFIGRFFSLPCFHHRVGISAYLLS